MKKKRKIAITLLLVLGIFFNISNGVSAVSTHSLSSGTLSDKEPIGGDH